MNSSAMASFGIGIISFLAPAQVSEAREPKQVRAASAFPLTREEMVDERTLQPTSLDESIVERTAGSSQELRWVELRFFSHRWKDGPWYGKIHVVIPSQIAPDRRGLVAMCPIGSAHVQRGLDVRRDFLEETARKFGIPVVSIPSMGRHFGLSQIHEMSDRLILEFLESRDPSWLPGYATSAVRARALTAVGHLTGHRVKGVVHLGSSISAHQAWIWPLYDERVKGLVATGDIGFQTDKYPTDGSFRRAKRPVFEAISKADSSLQTLLLKHSDPYLFGPRIRCAVLQVAGTNDFATPPSTLNKFLPRIAGPTRLVHVPNYAHGCGSFRHLAAFRMWIDHVFFERPLSDARITRAAYTSRRVTVTARIDGRPRIRDVRFVFATTSEPNFLRSRFLKSTPRANHVKAKWKTIPMERVDRENNQWSVAIHIPHPAPRFIAGFVDVTDHAGQTVGYVASPMLWLTDTREPRRVQPGIGTAGTR